jgi:hypothetical protein
VDGHDRRGVLDHPPPRQQAVSWLDYGPLLSIVVGYLGFLFGGAWAAERSRLAASVYCTAWTFYGSVGLAANRGLEFLAISRVPTRAGLTVTTGVLTGRPGRAHCLKGVQPWTSAAR